MTVRRSLRFAVAIGELGQEQRRRLGAGADVAAATARAEAAEDHAAQQRRELADLSTRLAATEAARDEQTASSAAATKDATDARTAAHAAELLAAEAQATARTLREVLDTVSKGAKDNRARS